MTGVATLTPLQDRPVLEAHRVAATSVLGDAERVVSRALSNHRLVDVSGDIALTHNRAAVGRLSLHYIDYVAGVTVLPQHVQESFYLVQVPLRGSLELRGSRSVAECGPGEAVVSLVGGDDSMMIYSPDCRRLLVKIPLALMTERESALFGSGAPTMFSQRRFTISEGPGRTWADLVDACLADLDAAEGLVSREVGGHYFERLLLDGLLLANAEVRGLRPSASKTMARAADFINHHLGDQITVVDVAAATHVSVRSLQEGFRREFGATPLEYVRNCRLDAIHRELERSSPSEASVGEVASRWGMQHLGRFAAAYRARFGETPSQTLRGSIAFGFVA
ncbi:AraC family transcriptional regulator [Microbacterium rhizophilus]|uniref:AraC family transcriptional regulator n=1 Tax=Microbacterium rhizophilus TaxID=3138934 RepID=UPI0031ED2E39